MSTGTPGNPRRRRIAGERRRPQDAAPEAPSTAPPTVTEPAHSPEPSPEPAPEPLRTVQERVSAPEPLTPSGDASTRNPWVAFVAALVAAVVTVTAALVLGLVTWDYRAVHTQDVIDSTQDDAAAAAERAAGAILSFSYKTLDADLQASQRFLTPKFAKTYADTFNTDVRSAAEQTKGTVTAKVLASAVVNATEDRAQILVYVDQTTVSTLDGGRPKVALNRTTFDMVKENGSWLVDNFASY